MNFKDYLKIERFPSSWCPGCGIGIVVCNTARVFEELKLKKEDITVVSGIGCTGRAAGYFNMDTIHGLHGRAIPLAEGVKIARPDMKVMVLSGDGDLIGIGGNHLIHACKRNTDITVICNNNHIYGMTGGQRSPMTDKGIKTITSPYGNEEDPVNVQGIVRANKRFFARTTTFHILHMKSVIKEAIQHKGFSFVEIVSNCVENYGRRLGFKNAYDMLLNFKQTYKIVKDAKELEWDEIGIIK
ncbi:MAG: 2-oxoacid:ferredoxin oxidoreductase subunit beta [Nanoarchaeota archaeon]|nr:2-oxoacid:ferredoxin oxidoreductase subunit beta [Nanoarchaeota archaeon]MCG2718110.1 thiamine pyrophosphate-dependent enzyme [Nanoarchaeota archaeon]